eukprot:3740182-Rhodomonas_salina.3
MRGERRKEAGGEETRGGGRQKGEKWGGGEESSVPGFWIPARDLAIPPKLGPEPKSKKRTAESEGTVRISTQRNPKYIHR